MTAALVAAATISVLAAIIGGTATKRELAGAAGWVEHTADVKLAVAEARLRLEELAPLPRGAQADRDQAIERLMASANTVCTLTSDNPRQQERCGALSAKIRDVATSETTAIELHGIFREMTADEDALMAFRRADLRRAENVSSWIFFLGTGFGALFGALLLWRLHVQTAARLQADIELSREDALMKAVLDSMGEAVIAMRPNRQFIIFNRAAGLLLGPDFPDQFLSERGRPDIEAVQEDGTLMPPEAGPLARSLRGEVCDNIVYRLRRRNHLEEPGSWVSVSSRPVYYGDAIVAGVAAFHDISELKSQSDKLRALSVSDELTGLHNRRGFIIAAKQQLAREAIGDATLVFADLNCLKQINDELGHEAGDTAICGLAQILRQAFPTAVVGRLGGDEFALLLPGIDEDAWPTELESLRDALTKHNAEARPYRLSVSTGVAFYNRILHPTLEQLLDEADQKMYQNKRDRRILSMPVLRPRRDDLA